RRAREGALEVDLRVDVLLVADQDGGIRDVLETQVLAVEPIAVAAVDLDADRHVAERDVVERKPGFVLADRGAALAVEDGVDERERPSGRWLLGQNAVAAAEEAQILRRVADHVDAG